MPDGRACGDVLIVAYRLADDKAQGRGLAVKLVDVAKVDRLGPGQIVALVAALRDKDIGGPENLAGVAGVGGEVGHGRSDPLRGVSGLVYAARVVNKGAKSGRLQGIWRTIGILRPIKWGKPWIWG